MIERVIHRTRNLWIVVILMIILLAVIAAIWLITSRHDAEIPQKGVFVIREIQGVR